MNDFEIGTRFTTVTPSEAISMYESPVKEYTLGVTKYLHKHRVKLQSNLMYQQRESMNDRWVIHFQIELGI
ncbi:MAG: hypothetical protein R6U65_04720 [Perlabentimonas sp.]